MMLLLAVIVGLGLFLAWRLGVLAIALVLLLAGCAGNKTIKPGSSQAGWIVGPVVHGENRSPGAWVQRNHEGAILAVHIPYGTLGDGTVGDRIGELSGITYVHGSLAGKTRIVARFRIEGEEGVTLQPSQAGYTNATATLFFQRAGDNWGAQGKYEAYRWFATQHTIYNLAVGGEYEISAPLDAGWTATQVSTLEANPTPPAVYNLSGFRDALASAESVGIVFGGGDGFAHGIYASGPARFVLIGFKLE
jgi:hypothetical protein